MPPSWHPVPACTPRLRCRRAVFNCSSDDAAAIRKSGLEIKNRCSLWAVLEGFLASIPKSGLEIKNHCTQEDISGQNMQRFASLGLKSRIDAALALRRRSAGGPFFFAATNNRIGRGRSLSRRSYQAGHSSLLQRRLELAAEVVAATATAGGQFFFAARKISI